MSVAHPFSRRRPGLARLTLVLSALAAGLMTWPAQAAPPAAGPQDELTVHVYLPVGLSNDSFVRPPAGATLTPTSPATLPPTEAPTETPSPTPTETPTPSPTADDKYREPLTSRASLDDLRAAYTPAKWYETLLAVLERRYGTGHYIVQNLTGSRTEAARWTNGRTGSFDDLLGAMELTVHEMDHQLGIELGFLPSFGKEYHYQVRGDLAVKVKVSTTFNRSEIAQYVVGPLDNMYKNVYLTGQSGAQGFFTLLDEFNAYTHSIFTGYGLHDQYARGRRVSHRDGLVTMMMYVEFYLRHGRTKHPADYAALRADPEVKALVKLLWDRANFILDSTADIPALALDAAAVEAEMRKPEMLDEVARYLGP